MSERPRQLPPSAPCGLPARGLIVSGKMHYVRIPRAYWTAHAARYGL
jgi:hypothetical protein